MRSGAEAAVDVTPEPMVQAALLNLAPLSPTTDTHFLGAGYLNPFPTKPLSVKQWSFMYLHQQHSRWGLLPLSSQGLLPAPGSCRVSRQELTVLGRGEPETVSRSVCCNTLRHQDCDSRNLSRQQEQDYILSSWWAKAALWVWKLPGGSARTLHLSIKPCTAGTP